MGWTARVVASAWPHHVTQRGEMRVRRLDFALDFANTPVHKKAKDDSKTRK